MGSSRLGASALASSAVLGARLPSVHTSNSCSPRCASTLRGCTCACQWRRAMHSAAARVSSAGMRHAAVRVGCAHSLMDCAVSTVAFG